MRVLVVLAVIVLLMSWVGWLTYNSGTDRSAVVIEQAKIQADAERAVEATKDFAEEAVESTRETLDGLRGNDEAEEPVEPARVPAPAPGP